MTRVLCVGIAVVDFIFRYDVIPRTPGKHIANAFDAVVGGMAANAAIAAARLGGEAALMSRVGVDPNGSFTLAELSAQAVGLAAVEQTSDAPTSLSAVAVGEDGERLLFNHQDPRLLLDVPSPPQSAFAQFDALLVDTRWPAAGASGLELAASRSIPGVADIDHAIEQHWLEATLRAASHVVFSAEGLATCLGIGRSGGRSGPGPPAGAWSHRGDDGRRRGGMAGGLDIAPDAGVPGPRDRHPGCGRRVPWCPGARPRRRQRMGAGAPVRFCCGSGEM